MNKPATELAGVRSYFSATEERVERWRELHRVARNMANGGQSDKLRKEASAKLAELGPLEDLCGYPGPALFARVHERLNEGDAAGLERLTQRISMSLLSNSYRDDPEAWKDEE